MRGNLSPKKLKDYYILFTILRDSVSEAGLDYITALKLARTSIPSLSKFLDRVIYYLESGLPLPVAFERAGFERKDILDDFRILFNQGQVVRALEIAAEKFQEEYQVERDLSSLDRKFFFMVFFGLVAIFIMFFVFFPAIYNGVIKEIVAYKGKVNNWIFSFLKENYENPDLFLYKGEKFMVAGSYRIFFAYATLLLLAFLTWKYRLHRFFLRVLPSYRKIGLLYDKIRVLATYVYGVSPSEATKNLVRIFGEKYNFRNFGVLFNEMTTRAFKVIKDLFTEEEKNLLVNADTNPGIFSFLLRRTKEEMKDTLRRVSDQFDFFMLIGGVIFVLVLYGFIFYIMAVVSSIAM